ncbi:hypothetical protein Tco_1103415 [Tanacetum coccineum]
MDYLVKISKKARILELKQRHLKITVLTSYTPYPSRKIRRICACTSQETTKIQRPILHPEPKQEFRSSRKHFKTLSLDESRSPDFDLFSNQEEYSEEEVTETMAETMEQYMRQFLKELRDNTFSGSNHEDANELIEKVLEIVDLLHIPNITIDQVILRAFPVSLTGAASRWLRNKPSGSIAVWEDLKTKFLSKYCPPARTTKKMEEINNF